MNRRVIERLVGEFGCGVVAEGIIMVAAATGGVAVVTQRLGKNAIQARHVIIVNFFIFMIIVIFDVTTIVFSMTEAFDVTFVVFVATLQQRMFQR